MRASRLVSMQLLLQVRGRLTAAQLAEELEISVRTVYRDIEALVAAGIPVYGEPGHAGGYRLVEGYRARRTGLTAAETEALWLAGLPGPAGELGLGPDLAAAQLKLAAALPAERREQVRRVRQRVHVDTAGWYAEPEHVPFLPVLVEAVWQQRVLRVRYLRWKHPQEVDRTLEPCGVVLKAGHWYLVAGAGPVIRTYRVSQFQAVECLPQRFERPEDFDLAVHWQRYLEEFEVRRHIGYAVILMTPQLLARLPDLVDAAAARSARESAQACGGDGRFRVSVPVESVESAARMLLQLGPEAQVIAPAGLRERVCRDIAELAATYGIGAAATA